jgi:hypothetical protein
MPGRADLYKDGILAGADLIPYTPRDGTVRLVMGKALDIEVTRQVELSSNVSYVNHTVTNRDVSSYTVELRDPLGTVIVTEAGLFRQEGAEMVASVFMEPGAQVTLGWAGAV